ncbi:Hypothetical protein NTJ_09311 [Nesidiocoris tenuis]|uniref:Uncharacterized protein n=1 Tax=Nesidiocoris tenuis TaxID=355587 RepID=A0ABN7AWD6_9HEMI|nr:Hypothetical protein NTJ_09311 [Nesidiocoris tenuis]
MQRRKRRPRNKTVTLIPEQKVTIRVKINVMLLLSDDLPRRTHPRQHLDVWDEEIESGICHFLPLSRKSSPKMKITYYCPRLLEAGREKWKGTTSLSARPGVSMFTSVGHDLVSLASLVTVFATCRSFESYDVDEVDTYTRILLHPRNDSQQVQFDGEKLRANGEGPLIIDYPFPIHYGQPNPSTGTEYPVRLHNHHGHHQHLNHGHLPEPDTHASLVSTGHHFGGIGSAHLPSFFYPSKKKKKRFHKHKMMKHLIPILVTLALKIAHLLPTLKLMLLALFSLLLFSKKAFLVSVGTLILVLYQHMTSKYNGGGLTLGTIGLWKDRDQTAHRNHNNYDGGPLPEGEVSNDWWQSEGSNVSKIMPRDDEKWKRWWTPQIKASYVPESYRPPQLEEHASLKDRIKEKFDKFFGGGNSHH